MCSNPRKHYPSLPFPECDLPNKTYHWGLLVQTYRSNTIGAKCEVGSVYPTRTSSYGWGWCCSVFSFLCCVWYTVVCLLVSSFIAMSLSVYFQLISSNVLKASLASLLLPCHSQFIFNLLVRMFFRHL